MVIYRCDRCGKEVETSAEIYKITYWTFENFPDKTKDLCEDCHDALLVWLGVKEEEPHEIKAYKLNEPNPVFDEDHWREVTDKTERNGG